MISYVKDLDELDLFRIFLLSGIIMNSVVDMSIGVRVLGTVKVSSKLEDLA